MRGIIYYNAGTSCLVRLAVSITSLRKHYLGPLTVISEGPESAECSRLIAEDPRIKADFMEVDLGIPPGTSRTYLAKPKIVTVTPYDTTLWIDSDTLIKGDVTPMLDAAEKHQFAVCQFTNWQSNGSRIAKRIKAWGTWYPDWVETALNFGPAINCGVVAFRRDSELMRDWYGLALPGREQFIADETCCQLILPRYPHIVMEPKFNCSCKYDDPNKPDTRIIHFHGRKHCRPGLPFNAPLWIDAYEETMRLNIGSINSWTPAGDRFLYKHLRNRKTK